MRLFVSYARVDRPFCDQIVQVLQSSNEVWYDRRLHAGKKWWKEILKQIDRCEGFIYLLSPESVASEYCQKEYAVAAEQGKLIIPVKIQSNTEIPADLRELQIADLSEGMTTEAVTILMAAIQVAERVTRPLQQTVEAPLIEASEGSTAFAAALDAYNQGALDDALFKLTQVRDSGFNPGRFVDLDALLAEVQAALEDQARLREAEREYTPIAQMVALPATREQGCEAFARFQGEFPDFDPDELAAQCAESVRLNLPDGNAALGILPPPFEWCLIVGQSRFRLWTLEGEVETHDVAPFLMSKYPITYAQFKVFLDAPDGFRDDRRWAGLAVDKYQRRDPGRQAWPIDNHPRENVSWYDALAFCHWLTARLGFEIRLPTEWEWQWAAQGADGRRWPWGDVFEGSRCNTGRSGIGGTTSVDAYPEGASPHGVMDMAGNVWEWCLNPYEPNVALAEGEHVSRVIRGGSYLVGQNSARVDSRVRLGPAARGSPYGFRVVTLAPEVVSNQLRSLTYLGA